MDRRAFLTRSAMTALAFTLCAPGLASAEGLPLAYIPQAQPVGRGRLSIMMMPVFDITLFGPGGRLQDKAPIALQVTCLRPLEGQKLAHHAASEMRNTGCTDAQALAAWQTHLSSILPNVEHGDTLYIVRTALLATRFYSNGKYLGSFEEPSFTNAFFAICLGPKTSQPALRRNLLGNA